MTSTTKRARRRSGSDSSTDGGSKNPALSSTALPCQRTVRVKLCSDFSSACFPSYLSRRQALMLNGLPRTRMVRSRCRPATNAEVPGSPTGNLIVRGFFCQFGALAPPIARLSTLFRSRNLLRLFGHCDPSRLHRRSRNHGRAYGRLITTRPVGER